MRPKTCSCILIAALVATLGVTCAEKEDICDPTDQGGPKMKVEYDYQDGYMLEDFSKLFSMVRGAFEEVGTDITICRDEFWFSPDSEFFTPEGFLKSIQLEQFFIAHKTMDLDYYLASAEGLDLNHPPGSLLYWGATRSTPPNTPPNPKWSFVFVGDIPAEEYGGSWTKRRHVTYTVIHELGHQRAGLTHPEDFDCYHNQDWCIMHTYYNVSEAVLAAMSFCYGSDTTSADNCRYFLRQQNQR